MPMVLATELVGCLRPITPLRSIPHNGKLGAGEELKLSHNIDYPPPRTARANT
jgi:hypothetical protein